MGKMEIYKTTRVLHMWIKNNRNECIYIYMHMYMSIFIITYTYIPYLHMLSKSSIHIGHHPNLSVPPRSAFSPSSTGREMQYMLKAKLEHQKSAQNPPKHKEPIERPLDKGSLSFMSRNMDLFHLSCVPSACLHVALHVQSWYHNENRWNSLYNRKM